MANNVLVADDSLTIQKVVAITLASGPYNLSKALNEEELLKVLKAGCFELLLLDFNLSDSKSGYELAKEIKEICPTIEILAMLGTFDTVDEEEFSNSLISDKVTKPFESEKFINKCQSLISNKINIQEEKRASEQDKDLFGDDDTDDLSSGWEDSSAGKIDTETELPEKISADSSDDVDPFGEEDFEKSELNENPDLLKSELLGWGIEVPPVIGESTEDEVVLMPPVIENGESFDSSKSADNDESINLVEDNKVVEKINNLENIESTADFDDVQNVVPVSKLIPLEELSLDDGHGNFDEETTPNISISTKILTRNLSNELESESSTDDFWEVDDKGVGETVDKEQLSSLKKSVEITQTQINISELDGDKSLNNFSHDMSEEELVAKLKESLTPMLRELVKDFCKDKVEQIAWDIIPDLAENIIKKEVKEITKEVMSSE